MSRWQSTSRSTQRPERAGLLRRRSAHARQRGEQLAAGAQREADVAVTAEVAEVEEPGVDVLEHVLAEQVDPAATRLPGQQPDQRGQGCVARRPQLEVADQAHACRPVVHVLGVGADNAPSAAILAGDRLVGVRPRVATLVDHALVIDHEVVSHVAEPAPEDVVAVGLTDDGGRVGRPVVAGGVVDDELADRRELALVAPDRFVGPPRPATDDRWGGDLGRVRPGHVGGGRHGGGTRRSLRVA
jgi:hypothetical protein